MFVKSFVLSAVCFSHPIFLKKRTIYLNADESMTCSARAIDSEAGEIPAITKADFRKELPLSILLERASGYHEIQKKNLTRVLKTKEFHKCAFHKRAFVGVLS